MSRRPHYYLKLGSLMLLALVLAACSARVKPYTSAGNVQHNSRTDTLLWATADKFDEEIRHTKRIYPDAALQAYLQTILDRLYPDFIGHLRIRVFRDSSLNAFALANGSLYIHTALLARCENEAQAATILGHEAAHFVDRHALRETQQASNSIVLANIFSLTGLPLIGPLLAVSSIMGYSREMESTADRIAYQRLVLAGYDTRESVKIFQRFADETKNMGGEEPYFFSSHPRMVERVASLNAMLGNGPSATGETGSEAFLEKTALLRIASLEEDLSMNRYKSVIMLLETPNIPSGYPKYYKYFLAEAYRQRGETGDETRSLQAYQEAVQAAPDFPSSYRALGLHYLKQKDDENARKFLEIYLRRVPEADDRQYIQQYINNLEKGERS